MTDIFANLIAAFVTIPFLGFLVVFAISKKITRNKRRSFHLAIDCSTLLLILSVHHLIQVIWHQSYLWVILLIMIFEAMIFVIIHYKMKREMEYKVIFKGFWRMNFLLFFSAHIMFGVVGLFHRINSFISSQ